jgi:endonuclease YncB( thermonuclease family)
VRRLLALLLFLPAGAALAESFVARSVSVLDGDTVLVRREAGVRPMKVRLADIDAPEKEQDFGDAAKQSLAKMLSGRQVRVDPVAVDMYGRLVARLYIDDVSVNAELIRQGMAWEYSLNRSNREYLSLQDEARRARRGLWAQQNPVAPSQWRKLHPPVPHEPLPPDYLCGSKQHCGQIATCDEAHYHLSRCGVKALDPDGDGLPCDALCAGRQAGVSPGGK